MNRQHSLINNLGNVYTIPKGSPQLPNYKAYSGKESTKHICTITWNQILKELSIASVEKFNRDPYWINNTKMNNLKVVLKKHFLESY